MQSKNSGIKIYITLVIQMFIQLSLSLSTSIRVFSCKCCSTKRFRIFIYCIIYLQEMLFKYTRRVFLFTNVNKCMYEESVLRMNMHLYSYEHFILVQIHSNNHTTCRLLYCTSTWAIQKLTRLDKIFVLPTISS